MEQYDEELHENLFFQAIQYSFPSILDIVSVSGWMVLVPCKNSLDGLELNLDNIENHVVKAQEEEPTEFYTLNKKELVIKSGIIVTGKGFSAVRKAMILFEEMFYNKDDGGYRVLCISQPLDGDPARTADIHNLTFSNDFVKSKRNGIDISQLNFEDSCQYLWGSPKGSKTKYYLTKSLDQLAKDLSLLNCPLLQELVERVKKTYDCLVRFLVKTPQFKKASSHFGMCLALETFMMQKIYRQLMRLIGMHTKDRDCLLNKATRNSSNFIELEHIGINIDYHSNLEKTRIVLNHFVRHVTPNAKIYHLRKVFYSLLYSFPCLKDGSPAMTSDELIPLCSFVIIKSNVNNWWCHLLLMRNFCFSLTQFDQELEYFLSTLEASIVYLMSGKISVLDAWSEALVPPVLSSVDLPSSHHSSLIKQIYEHILENSVGGLEELKIKIENNKYPTDLIGGKIPCHPLCSCPGCSGEIPIGSNIRSIPQALRISNEAGFTVLHASCILGYHDIIDWLLINGADVNERCRFGYSPLHLACAMGSQVIILLLLSHGADISATDENDNTPLHIAALHGHFQCAKALIFVDQPLRKLDINALNDQMDTALHIAAKWGYDDICDCLIESGASCLKRNRQHLLPSDLPPYSSLCHSISKAGEESKTATLVTKRKQSLMMKKYEQSHLSHNLLNPDINPIHSRSPLSFSESSLSSPTSSSFSSSSSSKTGQTLKSKHLSNLSDGVLKFKFNNRQVLCDSLFESKQIDLHSDDHGHRRDDEALHSFNPIPSPHSSSKMSSQTLKSSSDKMTTVHDDDENEKEKVIEQLLKSAKEGNIDLVKQIFNWSEYEQDHPDATGIDVTKVKLCHPLCQCEKCADAQWFLSTNQTTPLISGDSTPVNVNSRSSEGYSALHMSCRYGHSELTSLLLKRGATADPGATLSYGHQPLHLACQQPRAKIVFMLLNYGADVNVVDTSGNTPLHSCASHYFFHHALLLLLFHADVNAVNGRGNTPLYNAVRTSNAQLITLLLLFGADLNSCKDVCLRRLQTCPSLRRVIIKSILLHNSTKRNYHPTSASSFLSSLASSSSSLTTLKSCQQRNIHDWPSLFATETPKIFRGRRNSWSQSHPPCACGVYQIKMFLDDSRMVEFSEARRWSCHFLGGL